MSDDHTSQAWGIYGGILEVYVLTPNIRLYTEPRCHSYRAIQPCEWGENIGGGIYSGALGY